MTIKEKIEEIKLKHGVGPEVEWIDGKIAIKILNEISELPELKEEDEESD